MDRIITSLGAMGVDVADGVAEACTRLGVAVGAAGEVQPIKVSPRTMKIEIRFMDLWEWVIYVQFVDGTPKVCKTGAACGPSG